MPKDSDVDGTVKEKNVFQDVIAAEKNSVIDQIGIQTKNHIVVLKLNSTKMNSPHISVKETVSMKMLSDNNVKKKLMVKKTQLNSI